MSCATPRALVRLARVLAQGAAPSDGPEAT